MNENIKEIVNIIGNAELSNKCHKECFINTDFDNECSLCRQATALVKAGYRKQSETVKEFAEQLKKECHKAIAHNDKAMGNREKVDEMWYICSGQNDGLDFVLKTMNNLAEQYGKEEK